MINIQITDVRKKEMNKKILEMSKIIPVFDEDKIKEIQND